jgi:hypothetical protein
MQSPAQGVPQPHYMLSPAGHYQSPMHAVPPSPVVDCWGLQGLPGWFPFASAAHVVQQPARPAPPPAALVAYDALMKKELEALLKCCIELGEPVAAYGQVWGP